MLSVLFLYSCHNGVLEFICVFFFKETATTEIYTYRHTLSLHDALPIFRHDKVQSKWMRRGPPSGADAFDREPEGITVFEHDMNMRGIDPGAGRDACDISLRAKCLGDDVRRALVRTAPGVLA